jgi:hypothetical protein
VLGCRGRTALQTDDLPGDLFKPFHANVSANLNGLLPDFYRSDHYREACTTPRGVLWRTIKLTRLNMSLIDLLQEQVCQPGSRLSDSG